MAIHSGMDVSNYQGDINWKRIKASSIEFAIIRASYGYGNIIKQTDARFHKNAYEAAMAGLFIGAYHNTFATTPDEVKKEAGLFLKVIDGYRLAYPAAVNMEDYMLRYLPSDMLGKVAETWCSELQSAGYYPLIFGTPEFFKDRLKKLPDGADIWLSEPGETPAYEGTYGIRQYTLGGRLDGVRGLYNLDFANKDYAEIIYSRGLNGFSPPTKADLKKEAKARTAEIPITVKTPAKAAEPPQDTVTVKEGETLFGIASRYGMTEKELHKYKVNRAVIGRKPGNIRPGMVLSVPGKPQWPTPALHVGAKVEYHGPVCRNSYGWLPHSDVGGTFTLTKIINGRKTGARLNKLGWVPVSDLKPVQ